MERILGVGKVELMSKETRLGWTFVLAGNDRYNVCIDEFLCFLDEVRDVEHVAGSLHNDSSTGVELKLRGSCVIG